MDPFVQPPPPPGPSQMARVVERNIQALLARRQEEDRRKAWQDRLADRITAFTGSMTFVYLHLVIFGLWIIIINLGWVPFLPRFDPSFVVLAMAASVEAIFLSTRKRQDASASAGQRCSCGWPSRVSGGKVLATMTLPSGLELTRYTNH